MSSMESTDDIHDVILKFADNVSELGCFLFGKYHIEIECSVLALAWAE